MNSPMPEVRVNCSGMRSITQTISHPENLNALSVALVAQECYLFPSCTNLGATVVSCSRVLSKNDSTEVCKNNPGRFVLGGRLKVFPTKRGNGVSRLQNIQHVLCCQKQHNAGLTIVSLESKAAPAVEQGRFR